MKDNLEKQTGALQDILAHQRELLTQYIAVIGEGQLAQERQKQLLECAIDNCDRLLQSLRQEGDSK